MTKEFIPYQQGLQLKELGFDEPCWAWWHIEDCDIRFCYSDQRSPIINSRETEIVGLPTYSQVFRWFREKDYYSEIRVGCTQIDGGIGYEWWVWKPNGIEEWSIQMPGEEWSYETYEEAEQACLEQLIQIVNDQRRSS